MLIVGCGDLGMRIAGRRRARGAGTECVVRSAGSAARLQRSGFAVRILDLDRPVAALDFAAAHAQILYLAPPPPHGTRDARVQRFLAALPDAAGQRIVYVSTSGVYGDCGGAWVDERRPANPQVDRARRRFDAEQRLRAWREAGRGELIVLRVAGIYGPGRLPLERLRRGEPMVAAAQAPWTNRIHVDDLVDVCEAAMTRGRDGAIYNVSDGHPSNMRDYFDRVADLYGLPRAPQVDRDRAADRLSPGMLSYLAESRRVDNRRMLDELGVVLRYPDLAAGLPACL